MTRAPLVARMLLKHLRCAFFWLLASVLDAASSLLCLVFTVLGLSARRLNCISGSRFITRVLSFATSGVCTSSFDPAAARRSPLPSIVHLLLCERTIIAHCYTVSALLHCSFKRETACEDLHARPALPH